MLIISLCALHLATACLYKSCCTHFSRLMCFLFTNKKSNYLFNQIRAHFECIHPSLSSATLKKQECELSCFQTSAFQEIYCHLLCAALCFFPFSNCLSIDVRMSL